MVYYEARPTKATLLAVFCCAYWQAVHETGSHSQARRCAMNEVGNAACDYESTDAQWYVATGALSFVR